MKSSLIIVTVLLIGLCVCYSQAATKPLSKVECKQIQSNPTFADNMVEQLINGVSGKIIEYYNYFFKAKSLAGEGKEN